MNRKCTPILAVAGLLALGACSGDEATPVPLVRFVPATTDVCPNGGQTVLVGVDDDLDGELAEGEIDERTDVCAGEQGEGGEQGEPGSDALVRTTEETAGANCANGGVRIDVGADANADGTLQTEEIEATSYVCNGLDGQDGLETLVRTSSVSGGDCESTGILVELGLDADRSGELDDDEVQTAEVLCSGEPGRESLVMTTPEPAGANCAVGGQRIESGLDENGDGVLDPAEVQDTAYVCDPVRTLTRVTAELAGTSTACPTNGGSRIATGPDTNADGALADSEIQQVSYVCNGTDGQRSLVATTPEPAGMNCANGGQRIDAGVDANEDDVLQPSEVTSTTYACNGAGGTDGGGGNAVRVASEPAGANCPNGGARIETGPDANGNGVLDDAEVANTSFACNGAASPRVLVSVVTEPAGANCPNGGQRIETGVDDNTNGTLEAGEVDSTSFVCDTGGTAVPFAIITQALPNTFLTVPYQQTVEATGGTGGAYSWAISAGSLPPGLSIDATGTPSTNISGTATSSGTYTFTVEVTDFFGSTATRDFTIDVTPPPCGPGLNGAIGGTGTTFTVPTSFSGSVRGMAADEAANGWVYFVEPGIGFNRFRKDGTVKEDDIHTAITGLAAGDIGYEMDIDGNNIYLTSDDISCNTLCVYRVSNDGGATFALQDLADFTSLNGTNDDLRGIHVEGNTMYVITHDAVETELYSINLAGTLPVVPTRLATFPNLEYCSGLDGDSRYLYTVCNDVDGASSVGVARIDLTTLVSEVVLRTPTFFTVGTDIISAVYGEDLDGDTLDDILYVSGDSGDDLYLCAPSATTVGNAFNSEWLTTFSGDDEGMAFDRVNRALYKVDEFATDAVRFN